MVNTLKKRADLTLRLITSLQGYSAESQLAILASFIDLKTLEIVVLAQEGHNYGEDSS
jgi:hypothetical protein